jgi:hypothetical protein
MPENRVASAPVAHPIHKREVPLLAPEPRAVQEIQCDYRIQLTVNPTQSMATVKRLLKQDRVPHAQYSPRSLRNYLSQTSKRHVLSLAINSGSKRILFTASRPFTDNSVAITRGLRCGNLMSLYSQAISVRARTCSPLRSPSQPQTRLSNSFWVIRPRECHFIKCSGRSHGVPELSSLWISTEISSYLPAPLIEGKAGTCESIKFQEGAGATASG